MKENIWLYVNIDLEITLNLIKTTFLVIFTYRTIFKLINEKQKTRKFYKYLLLLIVSICFEFIRAKINFLISVIFLILSISIIYSIQNTNRCILLTLIAFGLNYAFLVLAIIADFLLNIILIQNNYINLVIIIGIYILLVTQFFRIKKFKYGWSFLKKNQNNEEIESLVLTVTNILTLIILWYYSSSSLVGEIAQCFIVSIILMILNIKRLIQISYKRKLLVKELEETKLELENKNKQIKEMEEEILSFNKKSHSIAHKQKALEYKLEKLKTNYEISEEIEIRSRVNKIRNEITEKKVNVELEKTNIPLIDDMFEFLKSECDKNNIELNLKIYGNVYYMINNIISKEELEIIIADHVKNAIIAINHSDNTNKSILIKLGKIDDYYGIYVYDSGVEFPKEILENLGKKAITTYAKEGGSGMGFLNTFDTLRKYKASLIIEKIGIPSKDNFTKIVEIKFDSKNEYKVV